MTIDERIEKLVGRHEALTERHEANTKRQEALAQIFERVTRQGIQLGEGLKKQGEHIDRIMLASSQDADNIRGLVITAQAHQASIERL